MAKVLLVEDDNNLREIYQARLAAEGYDIVAAQNGEEALVVAKQNKPDLIISDVMMPRISGFEMLDILRNTDELKHTKIIMLTALGQVEDQKRADALGADKYLVKSQVTLEDIVNAAKELLAEDGIAVPEQPQDTPAAAEALAPEPTAPPTPPATPVAAIPVAPAPTVPDSTTATDTTAATAAPASAPEPPAAPAPATVTAPASVVPQADTTVVVPPAPANPSPPTVTTVAMPPVSPVPEEPAPQPTQAPAAGQTPPAEGASATPAPAPADTSSAEAAVSSAATQTLEAEEAALQAQIETYAKEPVAPAPATQSIAQTPADTAPAAAPAVDTAEVAASASNDQAIADAVQELNTPSPEESTQPPSVVNASTPTAVPPVSPGPAPAPAPAAENPADDKVTVAGKKVIQPISTDLNKPSLDELLAKEESKAPPAPATPVVGGTSGQPATPPLDTPGQSFDPNSVAL